MGSIFNFVIADHPIRQVQDVIASDLSFREQLDRQLLQQGIFVKPLNRFSMSTTHDQAVVDDTLAGFEAAIKKVQGK